MLQDLNRMCDESEKAVVIQGQLSLVEKLFEETDALQSAFEEGLEAEEQEASIIEWSGYRLDFLRSQARAHEVAGQGLADRAAPQELKTAEVDPNVRLPRLELPKFDGDVTRFHEFWDQFETSVHRQPGASGATKLAYLRGCLTGAALDTIEGLSASNQGYELALQRLRERFDRPMVAVREQILRLVDLLMTKNKLSTICDEFHKKVYALTALGKDPRTSDLSVAEVLIALCREQLPGSVQFRWDELAQANNAVVADLPAFLRFLQQLTDLPGASRRSKEPTRETTKARRSGGERKRNSPESPPRGSATFLHAAVERSCHICQKQHLPQQCPSLLRAGPHQRRELARRARLCFACLEPGHYASGCKHRGKTTDGKPVPASSPSTSASERSVAEQKTI
ncbi:zinc knuckle protein, partial [Trichinella spiralis]|uniref:zinc knuckle protein n=1 Tax=Trichinella spiralis TaxID=6334 RepID=UPI0001EFDE38